jgi:uncharacterized protein
VILYLDSSALLKLYLDEPGSETLANAFSAAHSAASHLIAYAEVRAGLTKALVMNRLDDATLAEYRRQFERHWAAFEVVMVDEALARRAGDLAEHYRLRGYDSVHLAAAEAVLRVAGATAPFRFAVFDSGLATAARGLGIPVLGD